MVSKPISNGQIPLPDIEDFTRINRSNNRTEQGDIRKLQEYGSTTGTTSYRELLLASQSDARRKARERNEKAEKNLEEERKETMTIYPYGEYFFNPVPKRLIESSQRDKPHSQRVNEFLYNAYGRNYE